MKSVAIKIPYCQQKTDSACCGPCCLKMLADFYNLKKKNGKVYSKQSMVALAKTDKEYGTQFRGMVSVLTRLGLRRVRLDNDKEDIMAALEAKHPILTIIPDNKAEHYVIVRGFNGESYTLSDPYYGNARKIKETSLHNMVAKCGNWIWEIYPNA